MYQNRVLSPVLVMVIVPVWLFPGSMDMSNLVGESENVGGESSGSKHHSITLPVSPML